MDQVDMIQNINQTYQIAFKFITVQDEEQSQLLIKQELDIEIPYRVTYPIYLEQQENQTPKTAVRTIENLETDDVQLQTETTPKAQIDVSSPRVPFLTHSQIMGMHQDEDEVPFTKSAFNNPLSEIPEELTPSYMPDVSKVSNQDVIIDNMSIVNSQQLKCSKKSSETNVISVINIDGSKLREELKEHINILESKVQELENDNFILKKKSNQEKVKYIELQMETEYKLTSLNEQFQDQEVNYKKQIAILKNDLNTAKLQINMIKQQIPHMDNEAQQLSQSQIQFSSNISQQQSYQQHNKQIPLSQSYNEQLNKNQKVQYLTQVQYEIVYSKLIKIIKKIDQQFEINKKDLCDLLQIQYYSIKIIILENKVEQIFNIEEEEKIDEHRTLLSTLKIELGDIKQIRGQFSRIFYDHDQFIHKRNNENLNDQKINELTLQIQEIKQEKLELIELTQKLKDQINQQNQIIIELQQKQNNSSQTDTQRMQSQFIRSLQTMAGVVLAQQNYIRISINLIIILLILFIMCIKIKHFIYIFHLSKPTLRELYQEYLGDIKIEIREYKVTIYQQQQRKNLKLLNSPQSRSENVSPSLKFLNSPKNSNHISTNQKQQQDDKKQQFYNRTSDFSVDNNSTHQATTQNFNNSVHSNSEIIQKLVDQFKGNSILAQKISGYSKRN